MSSSFSTMNLRNSNGKLTIVILWSFCSVRMRHFESSNKKRREKAIFTVQLNRFARNKSLEWNIFSSRRYVSSIWLHDDRFQLHSNGKCQPKWKNLPPKKGNKSKLQQSHPFAQRYQEVNASTMCSSTKCVYIGSTCPGNASTHYTCSHLQSDKCSPDAHLGLAAIQMENRPGKPLRSFLSLQILSTTIHSTVQSESIC